MKKMFFLPMGALLLLLAFTACSEEMAEVQSSTLKQIVMTASDFETEDGSRTNFQITSAGAEFSWAANDTVGIFPDEGAQAYFPMTSGAGTKSANFTGGGWALKDASTYAAYYPFIGDFYLNKNAIPVDFTGQVQTGDASTAHLGAYDYMAAIPTAPKNGNVNFAFKHLGALVQLKLTVPQPVTLNLVTLTTESNVIPVKGVVDVMVSVPSITSVTSAKEVTLELKELATTEVNQVVTLYMMLPPVDLSAKNLKAVIKTSNGIEEVSLSSKNFQAGNAYALSGSLKDPNAGAIVGNGTFKDGVVSIAEAGTMRKLLGGDYLDIISLKINGPINGDDIRCLRQMLGGTESSKTEKGKLTTLDLSEANIVEGGGNYYMTYYKTSNNVIGDNMFFNCTNLQYLIMPENVTSIGQYAFYGCSSLNSVIIGKSVTKIGANAFKDCSSLYSVDIPDLVTSIGYFAFEGCSSLSTVTIGDSVTSIGNFAFRYCSSLTSVDIPDSVVSIGKSAFGFCTSLTSIDIPNGVTTIDDFAFHNCSSLTSIDIPDSFTSIEPGILAGCSSLLAIDIPKGVTSIGYDAFSGCSSLTSIEIPDNVTLIDEGAFENCSSLITLIIGKSVNSIYSFVLDGCSSLTKCYCYATWPPGIGNFYNFSGDKVTLYVPADCSQKYKSTNWGKYFPNIKEID